jgi:triacylglycerol esterase/lipase EstA (alpha/beta hydrolase family)
MFTLKFQVFVFSEIAIYTLVGLWLWYFQALSVGTVLLIVLGLAIGFKVFIVVVTFLIGWLYRSPPTPDLQISFLQTLKMVFSEFWALLVLFTTAFPFEAWLKLRHPNLEETPRNMPVLLIHGFFCNGAYWVPMKRALKKQGITHIFTLNLEPVFADINQFAQQVADKVTEIRVRTGTEKVILVGHSMGGLVARAYLYQLGGNAFVAKLITLGSPHHGTVLARLIGGMNVKQMRPNNAWLKALEKSEAQQTKVPTVCIYSCHDNFIAPQESAKLSYAKNIPIAGTGHIEMTCEKRFQTLVYQEIIQE